MRASFVTPRRAPQVAIALLVALGLVATTPLPPAARAATFTAVVVRTNDIARTAEIAGVGTPGATVGAAGASVPVESDGSYFLVAPLTGSGPDPEPLVVVETTGGTETGRIEVRASVVPGGTVVPVAVPAVELDHGDSVPVPVVVHHREARRTLTGHLTLVAPPGTRFTDAPAALPGRSRDDDSSPWGAPRPDLSLVDPTLDADGTRLRYRLPARVAVPAGQQHRYDVDLIAVSGAEPGPATLGSTYEGGSDIGDLRARGESPVVVPVEELPFAVTAPDSAQLARGYTPGEPFTFRGTGRAGAPVRIENTKGLVLDESTVDDDGRWSWRRANMGTYLWSLVVTLDPGTPEAQRRFVTGFGPADETPGPSVPVEVTSPADPRTGYVAGAAFPFAGTSRPSAPIEIRTSGGLMLHRTQADPSGAWTWLADQLGSERWTLVVVADPGTTREQRAEVRDFAPSTTGVLVTAPTLPELVGGYEPARPYTFRGVVTPGSTVTVRNLKGLRLGDADVDPSGTWSWTRDNMAYYVWYLRFVRDEGDPASESALVEAFSPRL
jgi:hypothetical protein